MTILDAASDGLGLSLALAAAPWAGLLGLPTDMPRPASGALIPVALLFILIASRKPAWRRGPQR